MHMPRENVKNCDDETLTFETMGKKKKNNNNKKNKEKRLSPRIVYLF